ncbi:thiamine pyrophosphate-binding protein [Nocardioides convexus]|uniref:thiamine pyrophosphate-binding protein n=1 Tax=Nocardioides convexus TaxID=2712224 RepID=UPI002418574E|nr:thiamine pyrophosphate-binding protein [Nocardioides convexus]
MTSAALADACLAWLARAGVTDVVAAPGSRNAPLLLALWAAQGSGGPRLHTRIDERTAGFLALGLTKSGARTAVVTTSGTAVANLHPAVLEAAHSGIPLVVLSADRPARLRGTGANQTTDQVGIFSPFVTTYDIASEADLLAASPAAEGPLHLNVQARRAPGAGGSCAPRTYRIRRGTGRFTTRMDGAWRAGAAVARAPHGRGGRRRRRPACAAGSPRRPGGRCWPSRAAARARATTRCAPTGCCSGPPWASGSSGWWSSGGPRCPGRSPASWSGTTWRCSSSRAPACGRPLRRARSRSARRPGPASRTTRPGSPPGATRTGRWPAGWTACSRSSPPSRRTTSRAPRTPPSPPAGCWWSGRPVRSATSTWWRAPRPSGAGAR